MTDEDLHDDLDELAAKIEREIEAQRETLENSHDPDPKHRRMEEATVNPGSLFS